MSGVENLLKGNAWEVMHPNGGGALPDAFGINGNGGDITKIGHRREEGEFGRSSMLPIQGMGEMANAVHMEPTKHENIFRICPDGGDGGDDGDNGDEQFIINHYAREWDNLPVSQDGSMLSHGEEMTKKRVDIIEQTIKDMKSFKGRAKYTTPYRSLFKDLEEDMRRRKNNKNDGGEKRARK